MIKTLFKVSWKLVKFCMECIIVYNILEVLTHSKEIYTNTNNFKINKDIGCDF